jgi:prolipoprotein diacylglyceryltransferase
MTWSASPEIFTLGPLVIRWYGAFLALAFILGFQIEKGIFKKEAIDSKPLDGLLIFMVIGTTVGARLGHCLEIVKIRLENCILQISALG